MNMKSISPRPSFFQTYGTWLREAVLWGLFLFMSETIFAHFQGETFSVFGTIRDLVYFILAGFIFASLAPDTFSRKRIG